MGQILKLGKDLKNALLMHLINPCKTTFFFFNFRERAHMRKQGEEQREGEREEERIPRRLYLEGGACTGLNVAALRS